MGTTNLSTEELTIKVKNGVVSLTLYDGDTMRFKEAIKDYIDKFNNAEKGADTYEGYMCKAYICFHAPTTLHSFRKDPYLFSQDLLFEKDENELGQYSIAHDKRPIIHLTTYKKGSEKDEFYLRYARIMDSSIWNYNVRIPYTDIDDEDGHNKSKATYNFDQLKYAVDSIIRNSKDMLYDLAISHEYADLHARILQQSSLKSKGVHSKEVSPFLFHRELDMCNEIYTKTDADGGTGIDLSKIRKIKKYKWRIMLLDDHACKGMSLDEKKHSGENQSKIDKLRIISNTLRNFFKEVTRSRLDVKIGYIDATQEDGEQIVRDEKSREENGEEYDVVFYCVDDIKKANEALKKYKFEMILLDYLLGKKDKTTYREYSYELLNQIKIDAEKDPSKQKYKYGPHKRMYLMFISSFTTAVSERLLAEGLNRSEKYWHIAEGACPTNTPYLFLYRLFHLMNKRVDDMGIHKLDRVQNKYPKSYVKKNIIDKIFSEDKDAVAGGIKSRANDYFDKVLSLLYHYKRILDDYRQPKDKDSIFCSEESVLVTDFIKKKPNLGGLLEHLTQLVYLTAFGTVRQWPEMWEEYQFIKSITGYRDENIERYIYELKTNSM